MAVPVWRSAVLAQAMVVKHDLRRGSWTRLWLVGLTVGCAIAIVLVAAREYGAARFLRTHDADRMAVLATGQLPPVGYSHRANQQVLMGCLRLQSGYYLALLPPKDRQQVQASCGDLAKRIIAVAPTTAAAYLSLAYAAQDIGDTGERDMALGRSQALGAYQSGLSTERINLALPQAPAISRAAQAALAADLHLHFTTAWGRDRLAQLYAATPDLREAITVAAELAPEAAQRAFISAVMRASQP